MRTINYPIFRDNNYGWDDSPKSRVRPELVEFLRDEYPVGCKIQITEAENPKLVGKQFVLQSIDELGRFHSTNGFHVYTFESNTFKKI